MTDTWIFLEPHYVLVRMYDVDQYMAYFQAFSACTLQDGTPEVIGYDMETFKLDGTPIDEKHVQLGGRIKWDGCIDWSTNDQAHGCSGPQYAQQIHDVLMTAYAIAARDMVDPTGEKMADFEAELPEGAREVIRATSRGAVNGV